MEPPDFNHGEGVSEAILSFQNVQPEERTAEKLEWLSCFIRKEKAIKEQKLNQNVSVLKFSI